MKRITNSKTIQENKLRLSSLIDPFQKELDPKNDKKGIELRHVGKFLMLLDSNFKIESLNETPDFIITDSQIKIGLEHQVIVDPKFKEKEGYFENLCRLAEIELKKDRKLPNFIANIHIYTTAKIKMNEKNKLIKKICSIIKNYVLNNELIENEIIERINTSEHDRILLSSNLGAWFQNYIDTEILINAIQKKERKIDKYISKTNLEQWLLLVIGGTGESSYLYDNNFKIKLESKFKKVYLLEDFYNNLYEIN